MNRGQRLRVGLVVLVIGWLGAVSVEAGRWQYTCKDGRTTTSTDDCKNHGGVKGRQYLSICGDGVLDPEEQCDDGSDNSDLEPDACRSDCRRAGCGDFVIDTGEQCDDGNRNSLAPVTCRPNCRLPTCGDGVTDTGSHGQTGTVFEEECDDGDDDDSDGCMADCRSCRQLDGNIEVTTDTLLCPGRYELDDYGDYGAVIIKASGVTLDCRDAVLVGQGRGVGIVDFRSNDVTITNCNVRGYDIGIRIQDARNVRLEGNQICENRQRQVELIDATDIHGFAPSMDGIVACANEQIRAPSVAASRTAAVTAPASGSGGRESTRHSPAAGKAPQKSSATAGKNPKPVASSATSKPVAATRSGKAPPAKPSAHYLLSHAARATWTSRSGEVAYGSDAASRSGRAFFVDHDRLADGSQARSLLVTQPDTSPKGFIQGVFPRFTVGSKAQFKATVALAAGADPSSTVDFEVKVVENDMVNPVARQRVTGSQKATFDADLSAWAGKTVQLVVKVRTQGGQRSPEAVWINPSVTYLR